MIAEAIKGLGAIYAGFFIHDAYNIRQFNIMKKKFGGRCEITPVDSTYYVYSYLDDDIQEEGRIYAKSCFVYSFGRVDEIRPVGDLFNKLIFKHLPFTHRYNEKYTRYILNKIAD